jgi:acetyltransferase-like isoleucine patch superfamily enzyme
MGILKKLSDWFFNALEKWIADSRDRRLKVAMHRCGQNVRLYPPVVFYGAEALDIGDDTSVAPFVHIWCGGRVIIGSRCMIGSHVAISSLTHDYNQPEMWKTIVPAPVVIEDDVWIGAHAAILPGVTVGAGSVIGAGAVVTVDVAPGAIVTGIPGRETSYRPVQLESR